MSQYNDISGTDTLKPVTFRCFDRHKDPVYHTNVVCSVLERHFVICLDSVNPPSAVE